MTPGIIFSLPGNSQVCQPKSFSLKSFIQIHPKAPTDGFVQTLETWLQGSDWTNRVSYISHVIRVVDFVEDLRAVLLDGVHLHQVGRKLPVLLTEDKKITVIQLCSRWALSHRMEADMFVISRQRKINKIILCRTSVDSNRTGRQSPAQPARNPSFMCSQVWPLHLLHPLQAARSQRISGPRLQEAPSVYHQAPAGWEQAWAEPHQLPPTLHAQAGRSRRGRIHTGPDHFRVNTLWK